MLCCLSCILLLAFQGRAQYTPRPEASLSGFLASNHPLPGTTSGGTGYGDFSRGGYSGFSTESFALMDFSNPGGFRFSNEFYSASDLFATEKLFSADALAFFKKPKQDTLFEASPGVDPKLLPHILEDSFAQIRDQRKDTGRNMGIGLSVCRSIITAHGGTIAVRNTDAGAEFAITLPLDEEDKSIV